MPISVLQIPDPYNFLIQVRFKHQDIYESYFSHLVSFMSDGVGLVKGVHIESEKPSMEKFEYMPFHIGYDDVLGYIVIRKDGEVVCNEGDIDGPSRE